MTEPRRILILNERDPEHPKAGGAEIHVAEVFSRLADRGHQIRWYASSFAGCARESVHEGIRIERCGHLPRYYAGMPIRVRRASARGDFDLIVECLNKVPFYSPIYTGRPVLALCHHLFGEVAFQQVAWPIAAGVVLAERGLPRAYRRCLFVSISESSQNDLVARGIASDRIRLSHPGIQHPSRPADPDRPRPCRLAYLGRLESYKRVDVLLRAAAELAPRFPDLEVVVIGRGPERPALERLSHELGLAERTRFTGFVGDDERDELIADARACAFPSAKEGWGLTVIEANALGTPVVATDAPGLRDSVRHGETGLLAPYADVPAFAAALARLLEQDAFALKMRRTAIEWSKRFDWERAADEMESAIEQTLATERR
jgi:glycosyltransferase involved in cell wall biosynthesis